MTPDARTIEITRGSAWQATWRFVDPTNGGVNLTGCTGSLAISASTAGGVLATGTFTPAEIQGNALLALTQEQVEALDGHRVLHWVLTITDTQDDEARCRGTVFMID